MELKTTQRPASYKTCAFIVLIITTLTLYMLYVQPLISSTTISIETTTKSPNVTEWKYLVDSPKCKIPNLNPFNDDVKLLYNTRSYTPCTKRPLLSFITTNDNTAVLHINESAIPHYSKNGIACCYRSVTRTQNSREPDSTLLISSCIGFDNNATLPSDVVIVDCKHVTTHAQIYKNVHAAITTDERVEEKLKINEETDNHLSILCIGIDSVSRLNLMRSMQKTRSFLEDTDWIELRGYNKIADNTFPNLMGLLTGMNKNDSYINCNPNKIGYLDKCNMLWYDYRNLGYVTAYAEDEGNINTFNFNKKGFVEPPTDYYFRPYMLAAEQNLKISKVDDMTYCTGPETSGERILHLIEDFATKFRRNSYFGFFWMNSFSHNKLNAISRMDVKFYQFLENLWESGVLNNTIIFLFSDHGLRFGSIRYTHTGWLEERLPFFFVSMPKWFRIVYPRQYWNIWENSNRLTTPYDVYMTLQDLLVLAGKNYSVKASNACPKCESLFEKVDANRSCEDAAIEQHWCTCNGYVKISTKNPTVEAAAKYVLNHIKETIDSYGDASRRCAKLKLKKIISSSITDNSSNWYKNDTYLLIIFKTVPESVFEATVGVQTEPSLYFTLEGSVSRLDYYDAHSHCVQDSILKKYCYCHSRHMYLLS